MTQLLSPIVLFIAVSHLLLPTNSKATTLKEDVAVAQQSLLNCQKKQVQAIDDKKSDPRVIALNLTELCLDEYETLNRIMARSNYDTTNEKRMFTIEQNSTMMKIEASLPVVKINREERP